MAESDKLMAAELAGADGSGQTAQEKPERAGADGSGQAETDRSVRSRITIDITGVQVDPVNIESAAEIVAARIREYRACCEKRDSTRDGKREENHCGNQDGTHGSHLPCSYVCTPNAEIMMMAQKDAPLKQILNEAALLIADGAGVVLAAKLLGYGSIPRVPGFDLTKKLLTEPEAYPFSFYFLGGKPGVAETAAQKMSQDNPAARIVGFHDGYFKQDEEPALIEAINQSGADILLVALGAPKQEKWISQNRDKLTVPVAIGVGGSLDIFAGTASLAPGFFRRNGLEWLYRLIREPWRFRRMMRLPQYVLFTLRWRLTKRKQRQP